MLFYNKCVNVNWLVNVQTTDELIPTDISSQTLNKQLVLNCNQYLHLFVN